MFTKVTANELDSMLRQAMAYQQADRVKEALGLYQRIVEADPDNVHALNFAGAAHMQLGDLEQAAELLKRATVIDPNYPEAHRNLGIALRHAGKFEEAAAAHRPSACPWAFEPSSTISNASSVETICFPLRT